MRKSIVLLTLIFISMFSFAQTSVEVREIKKKSGSIVNVATGEKLSKLDLKTILDEEAYDNYDKGRKQRIASYTFWGTSAVCVTSSITSFAIANTIQNDCINNHDHSEQDGTWMCDSFNQKTSDLTLNFGATNNGIGFTLKF